MRARRGWLVALSLTASAAVIGGAALMVAHFNRGGRPAPGSTLRVFFTGDTQGELEPCNCSGPESGGLPRRGGFLEAQAGESLLLDTGCMGRGARDFERLRLDAVLRGMSAMRYDAANVGEHEVWLGRDELAARRDIPVPLVSVNVVDAMGQPVVRPFVRLVRAGLNIAVTGVMQPARSAAGAGLRVEKPAEALGRWLPALRAEAAVLVLLADLDAAEVDNLAGAFPEITLILYRGRGGSRTPERVNRSVVASVAGEALYVGQVVLTWGDRGKVSAAGTPVTLDARFPASPKVVQASLAWYQEAIRGRQFDLGQRAPGWERLAAESRPSENSFTGSSACRSCHTPAHDVWARSAHAHAMETLARAGYEYSPECIVCHVAGYGAPDGYVSRESTPDLSSVGCESCHGRGGRHVASGGKDRVALVRGDASSCTPCHTARRSPGFSFPEAFGKIDH